MAAFATLALLIMTIEGCGRPRTTGYDAENCIGEECVDGASTEAASSCASNADCVAGAICNDEGVCIAEATDAGDVPGTTCNSTNDCPMGMFCDLGSSTCVECLTDEHCDLGLYCLEDGTCGSPTVDGGNQGGDTGGGSSMECESQADCPGGYDCVDGQCAPTQNQGISCTQQSDCDPYGRVCFEGQCLSCSDSVPCPAGLECSGSICIDPTQNPDGGGNGGGLPGGLDPGGLGDFCTGYRDCPNFQACDIFNGNPSCVACTDDTQCLDLNDLMSGIFAYCCTAQMAASGQCPMSGSCVPN